MSEQEPTGAFPAESKLSINGKRGKFAGTFRGIPIYCHEDLPADHPGFAVSYGDDEQTK